MSLLKKKEFVTIITPIPGFIPRQLAIDILHSHSEVITLNPLVLDHKPVKAPRDAASDEFYSTWYEITERIQYVPGLGRMGSGKIAFNGCFHNMPWGLQAHIYAPMSTDLRYKYRIAGNQPGVEPPETREMGLAALGAPADGLYLREDVEVRCSIAVMSFVKSQLKAASKLMVQRIIKKAELVDAGVLHAMIEDGKLRTINPADRSQTSPIPSSPSPVQTAHDQSDLSPGQGQGQNSQNQSLQQTQQHLLSRQPTGTATTPTPGSPPPVPYQVVRPQSLQQNPYNLRPDLRQDLRPGSAGMMQTMPQTPTSQTPTGLGVYGSPAFPDYGSAYGSYAGRPGFYDPRQQQQQQYQQQQQQMMMQGMMTPQGMYAPYGQMFPPQQQQQQHAELQASPWNQAAAPPGQPHAMAVEMPGDYYHHYQQPPTMQPMQQSAQAQAQTKNNRESDILSPGQWPVAPSHNNNNNTTASAADHSNTSPPGLSAPSASPRPGSAASADAKTGSDSGASGLGPYRSSGLVDSKSFASDLPTHQEEYRQHTLEKLDPGATSAQQAEYAARRS